MKNILLGLAIVLTALSFTLGFAGATWANGEALAYNRIHLSTSANTQVENDTLLRNCQVIEKVNIVLASICSGVSVLDGMIRHMM